MDHSFTNMGKHKLWRTSLPLLIPVPIETARQRLRREVFGRSPEFVKRYFCFD